MREIDRILALPRKDVDDFPPNLERDMSEMLRTGVPVPERLAKQVPTMLYQHQARFLYRALEAHHEHGGKQGVASDIAVGGGKTLLSALIPVICDFKRPMLLLPSGLREATKRLLDLYKPYWLHVPTSVIGYSELSTDRDNKLFELFRPDCIICDEVHLLGNEDSARTRKFQRMLEENPDLPLFVLSGSLYQSSISRSWHIFKWVYGDKSPLPVRSHQAFMFAQATDPNKDGVVDHESIRMCHLDKLTDDRSDGWPRRAIGERIRLHPGFASMDGVWDGVPLEISVTHLTMEEECARVLAEIATTRERPDGEPLDDNDAAGIYRVSNELSLGYWNSWDPWPVKEWRFARRAWLGAVREVKKLSNRLDSEGAIKKAIRRGDPEVADLAEILDEWEEQDATYKYRTRPNWICKDTPVIRYAVEWAAENPKGLIWVQDVAAAKLIASKAKIPYFGDLQGVGKRPMVEDHEGCCVLSIDANMAGRNLQFKWHKNLVLTPKSNNTDNEQMIGRTHRTPQDKTVSVEYVVAHQYQYDALKIAYQKAKADEEFSHKPQKLTRKEWLR
jgi:hypothetical protein